jgi:hypothetical protein
MNKIEAFTRRDFGAAREFPAHDIERVRCKEVGRWQLGK